MKRWFFLFTVITLLFSLNLLYGGELKKISIDQVVSFKGEKLTGDLPIIENWLDDSHYLQIVNQQLTKIDALTGKSTLIFDFGKNKSLLEKQFSLFEAKDKTRDYSRLLFEKEGEVFLFDRLNDTVKSLFKTGFKGDTTQNSIHNITFSPDSSRIAYTAQGNLYIYEINTQKTIRATGDGSDDILNGYASWVYYEEILGRSSAYKAFWWSPDSKKIAFMRFDESQVPFFYFFNNGVEDGVYGKLDKMRYPKPGYNNPTVKLGIYNLDSQDTQWVDVNDPNEHYLIYPQWNANSTILYFEWMNRGQNHSKILLYDSLSKNLRTLYEEKQPTWIDLLEDGDSQVLANGDFLIRSSKDGWFHLYYITVKGEEKQLTSGNWSVDKIGSVDEKKGWVYFTAMKEDSTETDFYKVDFHGKNLTKLTDFKGTHYIKPSTGSTYFIDTYSSLTVPTRMEIRNNRGKLIRKIADSYLPVIEEYALAKPELFRVKTDDGFQLPVVWYLPYNFDKNKKYPVIISIYGGPASMIVQNSYGGGYRGGLEKYYLADQGIITVFVDNRASGHFGKKGMDFVYRQLGKWEIHDYSQVVKYLKTLSFIDQEKIGIKGHSFGGYVAAYALTYGAEDFKYGISASPVIDWRLYDSVYTERYMSTPQENLEGYVNSSAFTYMDRMTGILRITHGLADENVHPQNTIQFVDKALDANKDIRLMLYPGNHHGIRGKKRFENIRSDIRFWLNIYLNKDID